jgi:hypothetical protein
LYFLSMRAFSDSGSRVDEYVCCVVYFEKNTSVQKFKVTLTPDTVKKLFKSNYPFSGERIATPENATIFGCVILSYDKEIATYPIYTWQVEGEKFFSFQSSTPGEAPLLYALKNNKEEFFNELRNALSNSTSQTK